MVALLGELTTAFSELTTPFMPEKAEIICYEDTKLSFTFFFNPETVQIQRRVVWEPLEDGAKNRWIGMKYSEYQYQLDEFRFKMLFDETMPHHQSAVSSILSQLLGPIAGALPSALGSMLPGQNNDGLTSDTNKPKVLEDLERVFELSRNRAFKDDGTNENFRPPVLVFKWADMMFTGVLAEVMAEILLVDEKGIPRRATAELAIFGNYGRNITKVADAPKLFASVKVDEAETITIADPEDPLEGVDGLSF